MSKPLLIAVAGIAKSGKNTFCNLLEKELILLKKEVRQVSFAYQLRMDTEDFLKEKFLFDVWKNDDKEKFRPFLVWFANLKREQSNGQYFINGVKEIIDNCHILKNKQTIFLLSDLRFANNFEHDELDFVKERGGIVVHISKYKEYESSKLSFLSGEIATIKGKKFDNPPNEFEAKNDPILKAASDYQIQWEDQGGKVENLKYHVDKFVDWLLENKYIIC